MHTPKLWKCSACGAEVPDLPMAVQKHQISHVRRRPLAGGRPANSPEETGGDAERHQDGRLTSPRCGWTLLGPLLVCSAEERERKDVTSLDGVAGEITCLVCEGNGIFLEPDALPVQCVDCKGSGTELVSI